MIDILETIYHDTPLDLQVFCSLENPRTPEERKVSVQLRAVDEKVAEALQSGIEDLAASQAEYAFYSGVQFGARLMAQLLTDRS
ncbi:MAG: hypothetical protein HFG09_01985 [Oscillibacter sp.]|nr:hypothetical protein [Oscillibacter sp.]